MLLSYIYCSVLSKDTINLCGKRHPTFKPKFISARRSCTAVYLRTAVARAARLQDRDQSIRDVRHCEIGGSASLIKSAVRRSLGERFCWGRKVRCLGSRRVPSTQTGLPSLFFGCESYFLSESRSAGRKIWVFLFATKDAWAALSVLVGIGTNICDAQETKERLGGGAAGALSLARTAGTLTTR